MNSILLLLLLNLTFSGLPDCNEFYSEHLDPYDIDGIIKEKKKDGDFYVLVIKQKNGKEIDIRLLPDMTGTEIFLFSKVDGFIVVRRGSRSVHMVVPVPHGLEGKIFQIKCR